MWVYGKASNFIYISVSSHLGAQVRMIQIQDFHSDSLCSNILSLTLEVNKICILYFKHILGNNIPVCSNIVGSHTPEVFQVMDCIMLDILHEYECTAYSLSIQWILNRFMFPSGKRNWNTELVIDWKYFISFLFFLIIFFSRIYYKCILKYYLKYKYLQSFV